MKTVNQYEEMIDAQVGSLFLTHQQVSIQRGKYQDIFNNEILPNVISSVLCSYATETRLTPRSFLQRFTGPYGNQVEFASRLGDELWAQKSEALRNSLNLYSKVTSLNTSLQNACQDNEQIANAIKDKKIQDQDDLKLAQYHLELNLGIIDHAAQQLKPVEEELISRPLSLINKIKSLMEDGVRSPRFKPNGEFANLCKAICNKTGHLSDWSFSPEFKAALANTPETQSALRQGTVA